MGRASMSIGAAANDPQAMTPKSGSAGRGMSSADTNGMRERINELENLLYQSMEAQTAAEDRCDTLVMTNEHALQRCEVSRNADNELFSSLKMQLKLKTESIKHLVSKKAAAAGDAAVPADPERVADLEREVDDLKKENEELRKAQDAPFSNHPEYRAIAIENSKLTLVMKADGAFLLETDNATGNSTMIPNPDFEERRHVEKMARDVRGQFMHAVKDKKQLMEELLAVRASAGVAGAAACASRRMSGALPPISVGAVMSPASQTSLAAMLTPERKTFESVRLQMWREEQDFDAKRKRFEEELDTTKRELVALQTQLASAEARASFAAMELDELKPSIRRLSIGGHDMGDAASEIERIAKRAAEARLSCETEKLGREAALHGSSKLEEELRAAKQEAEEAAKREATMRHQLAAAEYAVAASERRANKQQRASLAADPGRLAQLQEHNEKLQLKLANVTDEYESRKEEFAFLEGKVQRITKEFSQQEEHARAQLQALDMAKATLASETTKIADLEGKLRDVTSGDDKQTALVQSLQEATKTAEELEKKLEESLKNEEELRDGYSINLYICIYMCMYIHITYIHIYYVHMYIYIYIYIYM